MHRDGPPGLGRVARPDVSLARPLVGATRHPHPHRRSAAVPDDDCGGPRNGSGRGRPARSAARPLAHPGHPHARASAGSFAHIPSQCSRSTSGYWSPGCAVAFGRWRAITRCSRGECVQRLGRRRHGASHLRPLDGAAPRWPGGAGLGGPRAAGRPQRGAAAAGAVGGGRALREAGGSRGAHGRGPAGGGRRSTSAASSPSSRPAAARRRR